MNAYSLQMVPGNVDLASMGLAGILDHDMAFLKDGQGAWKLSYPVRAHANAVFMTCGQGKTKCVCTGKCNTKHCSRKRVGRECNSRCQKNNKECSNLVRLK